MSHEPVEVRLLSSAESAVLERVDPDVFDRPVRLDLAAQYLANPSNLLAVAIQAGLVVGMASAMAYVHPDKPLALFINEVGVSDRYQGQGLGKRLMSTLLEQGRLMGCTEAWVATEGNNKAARALYASAGGKEDPVPAIVYTWSLLGSTSGTSTSAA
jgi:ribosomal protein S18 acetylase RimI-like enzyme